eukprot:16452361-Heterocapsa_arctica.AAC.1
MELDQEVFGAIAALEGASWVAGGDWNPTPEMIAEAGAVEAIRVSSCQVKDRSRPASRKKTRQGHAQWRPKDPGSDGTHGS